MYWQYTPYALPLLLAVAMSAALAFFAWRRRPAPGATPFAWLMLAVAVWSLGYAWELAGVDLATAIFGARLQYLGAAILPVAWLTFALEYTGRVRWLTRRNLALLMIVPLIVLALVWTNDFLHELIWRDTGLKESGSVSLLKFTPGSLYWVNFAYAYLLLLMGTCLLIHALVRAPHLYRGQAAALLLGSMLPWVGNVLYLAGFRPGPGLDLTPFAFTLAGVALAWGMLGFRLLDIVPVARDVVIESMGDAVLVLDAQNRIVDLNPAAQQTIGYTAAQAIGQPITQLLPDQPALAERRDTSDRRLEITLGEGEAQRYFEMRVSPLYRQSRLVGRLAVLHNITERKRVEEALRESEETTRALLNAPTDSALLTDTEGNIIAMNETAARRLGKSPSELVGTNIFNLFPPDVAEYRKARNEQVIDSGKPVRFEDRRTGKWFDSSIYPVFDAQSKVTRLAIFAHDITERKRAEDERERLISELDAFAHTVAHDLKNPLSIVLGFADVLAQNHASMPSAELAEFLQAIAWNSKKAVNIIDELLLLAGVRKLDKVPMEPLDMARVTEEVRQRLAHMIEEYQAEVILPDREAWPAALGYAPWVEEVWANYLSNAIKYGGRPPRVELGADVQDDMVRFWVRDNGAGLTPEDQARLFTPFTQLGQVRVEGHGLGLSIVRRIVEKLGGQVGVESEATPGKGSVLSFTLPATPDNTDA